MCGWLGCREAASGFWLRSCYCVLVGVACVFEPTQVGTSMGGVFILRVVYFLGDSCLGWFSGGFKSPCRDFCSGVLLSIYGWGVLGVGVPRSRKRFLAALVLLRVGWGGMCGWFWVIIYFDWLRVLLIFLL